MDIFSILRTFCILSYILSSLPDCLRDPAVDSEQFRRDLKTYLWRYDTSSHAFEVQIDTSSHGRGVGWQWVCLVAHGAERACVRRTVTIKIWSTVIWAKYVWEKDV